MYLSSSLERKLACLGQRLSGISPPILKILIFCTNSSYLVTHGLQSEAIDAWALEIWGNKTFKHAHSV